jgi:hypothetical protein
MALFELIKFVMIFVNAMKKNKYILFLTILGGVRLTQVRLLIDNY